MREAIMTHPVTDRSKSRLLSLDFSHTHPTCKHGGKKFHFPVAIKSPSLNTAVTSQEHEEVLVKGDPG